jgi:murein DD-endopeptidase MepM/ murein hydrolase activator NlpD
MATTHLGDGIPFNPGTEYTISAGWRYKTITPSGHFAADLAAPVGTIIISLVDGYVVDLHDGVANNKPGAKRWSGMPSNWLITKHKLDGKWIYCYWQHLNKGLLVKKGQKIHAGQPIARVGLSGNTSGPHLHWAMSKVPLTAQSRYDYMLDEGANAYWPVTTFNQCERLFWPDAAYPGTPFGMGSIGTHVRTVQQHLNVPMTMTFGSQTEAAVKKFQLLRPTLWPADGIVGPKTYTAICKK